MEGGNLLDNKGKKGTIPETAKIEAAKELGVFDQVSHDGGWGNVSSRDCGNIVKKTLEKINPRT